MKLYQICHYNIVPPLFLITTPLFVQYLASIGQDKEFTFYETLHNITGNLFSWAAVTIITIWAIIWLIIPSKKTYGPATYYNEKPEFQVKYIKP